MELLTFEITPLSHFATIPKGDTIFAQIVAYLFLEGDNTFANYLSEKPKLIVSDMMPFGYVYKPNLPLDCFKSNEKEIDKKDLRKRKFITLENLQNGDLDRCEKVDFLDEFITIKNSINRISFTTGGTEFAPYGVEESLFYKKLWMFILVEENIKDKIIKILQKIAKFGFGKDSSSGKGHFEIKEIETTIKDVPSDFYIGTSPTILNDENIISSWYEPYTKFGKYGLQNAHTNAFKKPVLMTDSATVVKLSEPALYFGNKVDNGIEGKPSFLQGYSIAIPFQLKDQKCLNIK